jgi:hypothetical protein
VREDRLSLLSNAFKFTLQGRIEVAMRGGATNVSLTVNDTGIGIPEAELPRIFERFHRIEGQHGRTYEGTGIGLALVRELVRQHGGEIVVQSQVGQGTTFTVTNPLGSNHLPTDRVSAPRMLASTVIAAQAFVEEALRWLPAGSGRGTRNCWWRSKIIAGQPTYRYRCSRADRGTIPRKRVVLGNCQAGVPGDDSPGSAAR